MLSFKYEDNNASKHMSSAASFTMGMVWVYRICHFTQHARPIIMLMLKP